MADSTGRIAYGSRPFVNSRPVWQAPADMSVEVRTSGIDGCGTKGCRDVIGNMASLPPDRYQPYLAAGSVPPAFRIRRRWRIGPWHFGV